MDVIRGFGVVVGVTLLGGCAGPAQNEASAAVTTVYFESSDSAPPHARGTEFAGPLRWARVDPRFRVDVDELAIEVGNWARTGGRTADAAPLLVQLADALDAVPRGDGEITRRDTAAIRDLAAELSRGTMSGFEQRRAARKALLLVHGQLAADVSRSYASDPSLLRPVDDLHEAALAISDSAPDSAVQLGFVTARGALEAFERSLARGQSLPGR